MLEHAARACSRRSATASADDPFVEVGIGLDYGEAFVGNVGGARSTTSPRSATSSTSPRGCREQAGEARSSSSGRLVERLASTAGESASSSALKGKAEPVVAYRSSVAAELLAAGLGRRVGVLLGPARDRARAGDHLAVVEHEDRHLVGAAQLLDLGPVLARGCPRSRASAGSRRRSSARIRSRPRRAPCPPSHTDARSPGPSSSVHRCRGSPAPA